MTFPTSILRVYALALASLAAACAQTAPSFPLNEAVARGEIDSLALPAAQGETRFVVRTVLAGTAGQRELAGARCQAVTAFSQAEFVSPARVGLPDLGSQTPVATVTCQADDRVGVVAVRPVIRNRSSAIYPAIGFSVGTGGYGHNGVGVSFGGLWTVGQNPPFSELAAEYPDIQVALR